MERGDKVATIYGQIEEVMTVNDCQVITYESAAQGSWWHPTKVFQVLYSEALGKYVTIPE